MTDVVDSQTRSRMMSGIRGKNTKPEILVRHGLHKLGFRYRLHAAELPGKPDIIFPSHKAVIMVNGCFWHGHDCHLFKWPSSRVEFWHAKINQNRKKDEEVRNALYGLGWRILVVHECALKGKTRLAYEHVLEQAASWIINGNHNSEISGKTWH